MHCFLTFSNTTENFIYLEVFRRKKTFFLIVKKTMIISRVKYVPKMCVLVHIFFYLFNYIFFCISVLVKSYKYGRYNRSSKKRIGNSRE